MTNPHSTDCPAAAVFETADYDPEVCAGGSCPAAVEAVRESAALRPAEISAPAGRFAATPPPGEEGGRRVRIVVEALPDGHDWRRRGYRWSVAGEGVPEIEGLQWNARQRDTIDRFAKLLALTHRCPAFLCARGVERILFEPTAAELAAFARDPHPTLGTMIGADLQPGTRTRSADALRAGRGG